MKKLYIAYGSNMDTEQMAYRCPDAKPLGVCLLRDWRLMFKGSLTGAYATIEKEKGFRVPALLWEISEADEKRLDRYEGFPNFYYKANAAVLLPNKTTIEGMAYIMREERNLGAPSPEYLDLLARAYEKFNFEPRILEEAYKYSLANEKFL